MYYVSASHISPRPPLHAIPSAMSSYQTIFSLCSLSTPYILSICAPNTQKSAARYSPPPARRARACRGPARHGGVAQLSSDGWFRITHTRSADGACGWALATQGLAPQWARRGSTRGVLGRQGGPFRERGPAGRCEPNTSHSPARHRVPHDIGRSTSPGTVLEAATCGLGRGLADVVLGARPGVVLWLAAVLAPDTRGHTLRYLPVHTHHRHHTQITHTHTHTRPSFMLFSMIYLHHSASHRFSHVATAPGKGWARYPVAGSEEEARAMSLPELNASQ